MSQACRPLGLFEKRRERRKGEPGMIYDLWAFYTLTCFYTIAILLLTRDISILGSLLQTCVHTPHSTHIKDTHTHTPTLSHRQRHSHRHWHTHIYDGDHIQKNLHTNDHLTIFAISKKFPPGMCQLEVAELLLTKHLYYIDNISYIFYTILYGKLYINIYKKMRKTKNK